MFEKNSVDLITELYPCSQLSAKKMYKSMRIPRFIGVTAKLVLTSMLSLVKNDPQMYMAELHIEEEINGAESQRSRRIRLDEQWRRNYTECQEMIQCLLLFFSPT